MNRLIILRGYPGSGKTTVGKILESDGYGVFIDHNAILTFIAGYTANDDGIYDDIVHLELAMTEKLLKDGKSVIVARGFGKASSVEDYMKAATRHGAKVSVIRIDVPSEQLALRVQSQDRDSDFNPTKTPAALKEWIEGNPLENIEKEFIVDGSVKLELEITNIKKSLESL